MGEAIVRRGDEWELPVIHGEYLSAVVFVMDYYQLVFNGSTLTAYTAPAVVLRDATVTEGVPGFRDRLCEQIRKTVVGSRARSGESLRIDFEDGTAVTVSLRDEDLRGAESARFSASPPSKEWMAWRGSETRNDSGAIV
jgi:hypothetical protein